MNALEWIMAGLLWLAVGYVLLGYAAGNCFVVLKIWGNNTAVVLLWPLFLLAILSQVIEDRVTETRLARALEKKRREEILREIDR